MTKFGGLIILGFRTQDRAKIVPFLLDERKLF